MTGIGLEIERNELNEINLNNIEYKMDINNNVADLLQEIKKKTILENIKNLNQFEHQEIFKIIKKYNIKYSENSNGIFINMNKLNKRTINEIEKFIRYCNRNNKMFKQENNIRNNLKIILENKIINNKNNANSGVNLSINKDGDIEQGISYQSDNSVEDDLEEIEDIDCSKKKGKEEITIFNNDFDKKILENINMI
tara:strand:- start:318 stop:905 length:588 start_codon:yes stop_codon:yes gene_type:complete